MSLKYDIFLINQVLDLICNNHELGFFQGHWKLT